MDDLNQQSLWITHLDVLIQIKNKERVFFT